MQIDGPRPSKLPFFTYTKNRIAAPEAHATQPFISAVESSTRTIYQEHPTHLHPTYQPYQPPSTPILADIVIARRARPSSHVVALPQPPAASELNPKISLFNSPPLSLAIPAPIIGRAIYLPYAILLPNASISPLLTVSPSSSLDTRFYHLPIFLFSAPPSMLECLMSAIRRVDFGGLSRPAGSASIQPCNPSSFLVSCLCEMLERE